MKKIPVYALVVPDSGARLQEAAPGVWANIAAAKGRLWVEKVSMANVARVLSLSLNQPILDKTGLTGRYSFRLEWDPSEGLVSVSFALRSQLGLRLEEVESQPILVLPPRSSVRAREFAIAS